MKRNTIVFIILIFAHFNVQIAQSQNVYPYKPLKSFASDTLDFIGYNFLQRSEEYKSKKVEEVIRDYSIPITHYIPVWNIADLSSKSLSEYTGIVLYPQRRSSPSNDELGVVNRSSEMTIEIAFERILSKKSPAGMVLRENQNKGFTEEVFNAIKDLKVKSVEGSLGSAKDPSYHKYKKYMRIPEWWNIDKEVYEYVVSLAELPMSTPPIQDTTDYVFNLIEEVYKEQEARKAKEKQESH